MFTKAQLKLTLQYSLFIIAVLWIFSGILYFWMARQLGEGYISQVTNERSVADTILPSGESHTVILTVAGEVALTRLRTFLYFANGIFLIVAPIVAWNMAGKTLTPIREVLERQRRFVSDASHELRTPLSIVSGELEIALKKKRSGRYYHDVLASTKEEVERLTHLVENLLFLAREDQGRVANKESTVDVTDIVLEALVRLQRKYKQKKLVMDVVTADTPSMTYGNGGLLRQLAYNLIDNAITYTPREGKVSVTLKNRRNSISLSVKDSGIGISKKDRERIFDRFYRADASRSQTKGYGLGLAISKSIVSEHQGTITVRSRVGKGSEFIVTLPRVRNSNI